MNLKFISLFGSLLSYSFIFLAGEYVMIPFIFWLFVTTFDFGSFQQPFAIAGIMGIILLISKRKQNYQFKLISLLLLISPLFERFYNTSLEMMLYIQFLVSFTFFILFYIIYFLHTLKEDRNEIE